MLTVAVTSATGQMIVYSRVLYSYCTIENCSSVQYSNSYMYNNVVCTYTNYCILNVISKRENILASNVDIFVDDFKLSENGNGE